MPQTTISLPEVDEVQITTIMDNSIDVLMASTEVAKRLPIKTNWVDHLQPIAEHGYSALITVKKGDRRGTVLFDAGIDRQGFLHNLDALEVDITGVQAIVLSHGHPDHSMGLLGFLERTGTRNLPLLLHPEAYLERKLVLPNGYEVNLPPPKKSDFQRESVQIMEEVGPSMIVDDMILVSGEVDRTTDFERGFPIHYAKRDGGWKPDPLIVDDQCAVMNVRDKGLVIVTGCGHSGIVNIIRHVQHLTGIDRVHAVVGGFHLTGGLFESIIPATVDALQQIGPRYLIPGHCTGWSAIHQIAHAMPDAFIANSVGTKYIL